MFEISSVKVMSISSGKNVWSETNLVIQKDSISYDENIFEFLMPSFNGDNLKYLNQLLQFDITLNSTISGGHKNTYKIMFFVGENDDDSTNQNLSIRYELNGGKNSEENIVNFPNYQINSSMTNFVLQKPTKSGYEFLGWYKDAELKNQILII